MYPPPPPNQSYWNCIICWTVTFKFGAKMTWRDTGPLKPMEGRTWRHCPQSSLLSNKRTIGYHATTALTVTSPGSKWSSHALCRFCFVSRWWGHPKQPSLTWVKQITTPLDRKLWINWKLVLQEYTLFQTIYHERSFSWQFPIISCNFQADPCPIQGGVEGQTNPQKMQLDVGNEPYLSQQ